MTYPSGRTNNSEHAERLDSIAHDSDRLREQEERFGEATDEMIAAVLAERARLLGITVAELIAKGIKE